MRRVRSGSLDKNYHINGSTLIPATLADLARRRSEPFLTTDAIQTMSIGRILAEVYIQGVRDTMEVLKK